MTEVHLPRLVPDLAGRTVTAEDSAGTIYLVRRVDGEFEGVHAVTGDVEAAGVALADRHDAVFMTTAVIEEPKQKALPNFESLLTPGEVAGLFDVDPRTVTRWAVEGRLDAVRTLGGHRRYSEAQVRALLVGGAA